MTSELLGLGLLDKADVQHEDKDWPAYKKYFMHGTSHHIGLDTHDYGLLHLPIQENMVFFWGALSNSFCLVEYTL